MVIFIGFYCAARLIQYMDYGWKHETSSGPLVNQTNLVSKKKEIVQKHIHSNPCWDGSIDGGHVPGAKANAADTEARGKSWVVSSAKKQVGKSKSISSDSPQKNRRRSVLASVRVSVKREACTSLMPIGGHKAATGA
jgi:hypothetical protein